MSREADFRRPVSKRLGVPRRVISNLRKFAVPLSIVAAASIVFLDIYTRGLASFQFIFPVAALCAEAIYLARLCIVKSKVDPSTLVLVFVLYSSFAWALLPCFVAMGTNTFDLFSFGFGAGVWSRGLWLEALFFLLFMFGWKFAKNWVRPQSPQSSPSTVRFVVFIGLVAIAIYLVLYGPWTGAGYETAGDYLNSDLASEGSAKSGIQNTVFNAFLVPCASLLLFYFPKRAVPLAARILSAAFFGFALLRSLAYGTRAAPLFMAFMVSGALLLGGKVKSSLVLLLSGLLAVALLSAALVAFRGTATYKGMSDYERAGTVLQGNGEAPRFGTSEWLAAYLIRLDSAQNSAILAQETGASGRYAGLQPFLGSLVAAVPRLIWPDKPLALSIDNTPGGLPWYLCMEYRGEPSNNGSVSPAGIAFWEFGLLGVIFLGFLAGITTRILGLLAFRGGGFGALLFLTYCGMSGFRLPVGFDEFILIANQVWLPLFAAWFLYRNLIVANVSERTFGIQ